MAAKHFKMSLKGGWDPEPWVVLPSQMGHRAALTPEQRLCWAIIDSVIHDLGHTEARFTKGSHRPARTLRDNALQYIYAVDHYWAYSFDRVCEHLDVDPAAFRRALEKAHAA